MAASKDRVDKSNALLMAEGLAPHFLILLFSYFIADLAILSVRDYMLPQKAPQAKPQKASAVNLANKGALQSIISRNVFNPDGTIPEPMLARNSSQAQEAPPVPSQLPLELIGTLVMTNPDHSLAEINVKSKNQVIALAPKHDIERIATLIRVERNKAIIRNLNLGRLEYIEIKSQSKLTFTGAAPTPVMRGSGEIKQIAPNKFKLSRATIMKHTQDLSKLLMQASSIPRRKANGEIECFILTSFQPDSIYADLGVQQGDCIKSVNGEPIDSAAKAMELYNALKNSNHIKLTVESDGRDQDKEYTIE